MRIAVVGLSDKPERESYKVAQYLVEQGFDIIPVNPAIDEWNGRKSFSSLLEVEGKVDIVDIFRRSEFVPEIVDEAIRIGAKVVWMQLGIRNDEAAKKARDAGIIAVMDKCIKIEHRNGRLSGIINNNV